MYKFIFFTLSFLLLTTFKEGQLNAKVNLANVDFVSVKPDFETKTQFKDNLEDEKIIMPFDTDYVDDPEMEMGTENAEEEGVNGLKTKTYRVTYWQGKEVYRTLDSEKIIKPNNQKVRRGTKIIWKDLQTPDEGTIKYWKKMRVWATSYDPKCKGCLGRTYSGTPVVVGTCAVDPKVIVMGSHFYVPGYGLCSALDIGGAIKGNKIDLGFPDVKYGWWSARYTDIYLVDGTPKN